MQQYLMIVKACIDKCNKLEIQHIPREQNSRVDLLSKLSSSKARDYNKIVIHDTLSTLNTIFIFDVVGRPTNKGNKYVEWPQSPYTYLSRILNKPIRSKYGLIPILCQTFPIPTKFYQPFTKMSDIQRKQNVFKESHKGETSNIYEEGSHGLKPYETSVIGRQ